MNKQQEAEKYLFKQFLESYSEMPIGSEEFKDRPDVIYTTSEGKTIGIEITECIYDENAKKKKENQIKFNYEIIAQLEAKLPFKFVLDIELNNDIKLKRKKSVIKEVLDFCTEEFIDLNTFLPIQYENLDLDWNILDNKIKEQIIASNYRKLPPEILNICITRNDKLEKSTHFESTFGMVPNFSKKDLEKILDKKNKALKNYMTCNQYWLLIVEGWDFYSYFGSIEIINEIKTEFDKILIFRRFTNEVVSIK